MASSPTFRQLEAIQTPQYILCCPGENFEIIPGVTAQIGQPANINGQPGVFLIIGENFTPVTVGSPAHIFNMNSGRSTEINFVGINNQYGQVQLAVSA